MPVKDPATDVDFEEGKGKKLEENNSDRERER